MKIVVADDHALLTEAMQALVQELDPTMEILTAASFDEAVERLQQHPDAAVLLLDLQMPGMLGAPSIGRIRQEFPSLRCAILTGNVSQETARTALAWGVDGFVPKHVSGRPLLQILRLLAVGEKYVPPDLLMEPVAKPAPSIVDDLTGRELAILHLVADGKSNKVIARELAVEPGTVGQHLHHIFVKLGVSNRIQATRALLSIKGEA